MGSAPEFDPCIRKRIPIKGENFYFLVGKRFVIPVHPRENDPVIFDNREMIELICSHITDALEEVNGRDPNEEKDVCTWFFIRQQPECGGDDPEKPPY
jgi:hypothetical protein